MTDQNSGNSEVKNATQSDGGFFAGVVIGTIIGGVAAFLLTSEDGKKKAEKLIQEGERLLGSAEDKVEEVYESIEEQIRKAAGEEIADKDESSTISLLKRRFFHKNGKKLTSV